MKANTHSSECVCGGARARVCVCADCSLAVINVKAEKLIREAAGKDCREKKHIQLRS